MAVADDPQTSAVQDIYTELVTRAIPDCRWLLHVLVDEQRTRMARMQHLKKELPDVLPALNEQCEFLIGASGVGSHLRDLQSKESGVAPDQDPPLRYGALILLTDRAVEDLEIAVSNLLSGHLSVGQDIARDLMEIEFLLQDFALTPASIQEWFTLDEQRRSSRFGFSATLKRVGEARGLNPKTETMPDREEYSTHSAMLHPTHEGRSIGVAPGVTMTDEYQLVRGFSDLLEHGRRVVQAAYNLTQVLAATQGRRWTPLPLTRTSSCIEDLRVQFNALHQVSEKRAAQLIPPRKPFVKKKGPRGDGSRFNR